ncbi:MAG TPA: GerMN domain-containing protein [Thermoanaerobaculia bacterium]|nr:GerMN domain-containing protein [Thermoanaerobaculia bacterium]
MSRRAAGFIIGLAVALILGVAAWWLLQKDGGGTFLRGDRRGAAAEPGQVVPMDLHFPAPASSGGLLRVERRDLEVTEAPKNRIRRIVEALLAGPRTQGLGRPFPEGVTLGSVQLDDDGTAYIDFRWEGHEEPPPGGSTEEIQRIYSVVNSVSLNVPQAQRVTLLWNNSQRLTWSGHLDTSRPLVPSRELSAP